MDKATRIEITLHAVRWANNMLAEVQNNHRTVFGPKAQAALRNAVLALGEFMLHAASEDV